MTNVSNFPDSDLVGGKSAVVSRLQREILQMQSYKPLSAQTQGIPGLKMIEDAFPNGVFPTGTIHEFLTYEQEHMAATSGFIGGVLKSLAKGDSICIWVSAMRRSFPIAFKSFGMMPDRILFIDLEREKDVLWATEEALKCKGIGAVIAEVRELTFMQSRRLQLAVEESKVTGFILRNAPRRICTTASTARWQIIPRPSVQEGSLPGVGHPRWEVNLQKVRNGRPGKWTIEWTANRFTHVKENKFGIRVNEHKKMVG